MISFPNAKINLGLNVLSKRKDGYHKLSSCFYPVGWKDILEIIPTNKLQFTTSGISIPEDGSDNLCIKAYKLLQNDYDIQPVHIHLHKLIPIGAGLGGGSSDCAFTIKMLNEIFQLNISLDELEVYSGQLGSDCSFFVKNKPIFVSGTGDKFESTTLDLTNLQISIIYPKIHVSTREAYSGVKPMMPEYKISDILDKPISHWKRFLLNDFEKSVCQIHPDISAIKNQMYQNGALYASMTGSGSAVFGIFEKGLNLKFDQILSGSNHVWNGRL